MEKLSLLLWRERELLETLAYKLEVEQLILASGRTRWLAHSTKEVEQVLETLRETEVLRAIASDEVAEELGLTPAPTLAEIAEASPEPWRGILDDHRMAFITATREIADLSESNRGLITAGYRSARETLLSLGGGNADSYSPTGTAVVDTPRRRLLDRSL